MKRQIIKKFLIFLTLTFLSISAFIIRLNNFKKHQMRTIDEIVYYTMGSQMAKNILDYNTIPYGKKLMASGRKLPKYFSEPLFKHPPVFSLLISFSIRIFGDKLLSAEYISLTAGILMIPLIYLLATLIFDWKIGLISALFLWLDPITIMCSQKVWMGTTIAFFVLLSAVLFISALKYNKNWLFILSGISAGLAVNTKYTGILITIAITIFAIIYKKNLFKNKYFIISLGLPIIMLMPWFYWNYKVYGIKSVLRHPELLALVKDIKRLSKIIPIFLLAGIGTILYKKIKKNNKSNIWYYFTNNKNIKNNNILSSLSYILILTIICIFLKNALLHSLQPRHIPFTSWMFGVFLNETPSFYFRRLIEYSFIYTLSFIYLFSYTPNRKPEASLISISAGIILTFFIMWGNYQSRYILSAIPFLIILGVKLWFQLFNKVSKSSNTLIYFLGRLGLRVLLIYILLKTYLLDVLLSFTNNMCYF